MPRRVNLILTNMSMKFLRVMKISAIYLSRLPIFLQTTTKQSDKQSCHLVSAPTPDLAKLIVKPTFACVACGYSAISVCDLFNMADVCRWLNCSSYFVFFDKCYIFLINIVNKVLKGHCLLFQTHASLDD